jgi:hypothetical protein
VAQTAAANVLLPGREQRLRAACLPERSKQTSHGGVRSAIVSQAKVTADAAESCAAGEIAYPLRSTERGSVEHDGQRVRRYLQHASARVFKVLRLGRSLTPPSPAARRPRRRVERTG